MIRVVHPGSMSQKPPDPGVRMRNIGMTEVCVMLQNSTASRVMYGFLLLVTVVISCIMLAPGVQVSQLFLIFIVFFLFL
jgi:hypothetical protein